MSIACISTTRQWNIGDEFIRLGVERLIHDAFGIDTVVFYNRHPEIRSQSIIKNPLRKTRRQLPGRRYWGDILKAQFLDNSFAPEHVSSTIDLFIVAGSPGWFGPNMDDFFQAAKFNRTNPIFLGLGMPSSSATRYITDNARTALQDAEIATVRDEKSQSALKPIRKLPLLPCPALLSFDGDGLTYDPARPYGLVWQKGGSGQQQINPNIAQTIEAIYKVLLDRFDVVIICHFIEDLFDAKQRFPGATLRYHPSPEQFRSFYSETSYVIGPRVHAVGGAASIGVPGLCFGHDARGGTVSGFLAENLDIAGLSLNGTDEILDFINENIIISETDLLHRHDELKKHKSQTYKQYIDIMNIHR